MPLTKKQELALKLLKGAKKHLRKDGWHQGSFTVDEFSHLDVPGPYCVVGAFHRAYWDEMPSVDRSHYWASLDLEDSRVYATAFGNLKERKKRLGGDVPLWNDESGRTKKEVIAYLDERIAILEAKA